MRVFINGFPINEWPISRQSRLADMADIEDVEYEDITESITIQKDENVKGNN